MALARGSRLEFAGSEVEEESARMERSCGIDGSLEYTVSDGRFVEGYHVPFPFKDAKLGRDLTFDASILRGLVDFEES